jgi:hypothetical protein
MTPDQWFESFRKASVASLQMQQEVFRQWTQQWPSMPLSGAEASVEWLQKIQKRWVEFMTDSLNTSREALDSMYKSLIQVIEQTSHLSDAKTPEEYRRTTDEIRHKMFDTFKEQSETQLRELQKNAEKWFNVLATA